MNSTKVILTLCLFLSFYFQSNTQTIDRGPYLQSLTTGSIFIHWRTDTSTNSKVWYGADPGNLNQIVSDLTNVTNHEILIPGLAANTIYYYAVGYNNVQLAGGDADHYFRTSPAANQPIKVWVLGDAGKKNDDQRAVRDAYYNFAGNEHIDMMLLLGDNAYEDGTQEDYQDAWFENMYEARLINSVMWSTFGNHDGISADSPTQTGPYYEIFNFPKNGQAGGVPSGTEAYYSFDYGNIHIISLNSNDIPISSNSAMIQWLQSDVDANTKDWMIAMFHHPAYVSSTSPMEIYALPILEAGGVDLVLVGHNHRYERSFLISGHYGTPGSFDPPTMALDEGDGRIDGDGSYIKNVGGPGTIYMTTGSAGSAGSGNSAHPIMIHNAGILGSVDIQVNDLQMDLKFIDSNGNIEDYFTISKQGGPPNVSITNPLDDDFYPAPENINITVDATDDGSVSQVDFFIDNELLGIDYTFPYSKNWTIPGNGSFEIKATATDNDNFSASNTVTIHVGDAIVCSQIDSSNDDAEEANSGGMSLTSSDLELVQENSLQTVGLRFNNLNIPQGAFINEATIQFTSEQTDNINPCVLEISAQASDNAITFSTGNFNVSSRPRTSSTVNWSPANWVTIGEAGPAEKTIDISTVIQEVVDRPGYTSNSSIVIIIEGSGKRTAEAYNGVPAAAPELCVEFSLQGPLPIELLEFNAKPIGKEVKLNWTTASEINNDFFTIERSTNGRLFQNIATIPGNGTTSGILDYNYFDKHPEIGLNYYRLKQTDFDGQFSFSRVVNVQFDEGNYFQIFPSVVEVMVTIHRNGNSNGETTLSIHDLTGRSFKSLVFEEDEIDKEISLEDLIPGVYFVSIYNNESVETFKIIKQ